MANDRISTLEASIDSQRKERDRQREDRDRQIGDIAVDIAENREGLAAIAHRITALESIKQPTALNYWGPAIAAIALVGAVVGSFLTMVQREQTAQYEIMANKAKTNGDNIALARDDVRRQTELNRSQGETLSAVDARQQMLEKQMDRLRQ